MNKTEEKFGSDLDYLGRPSILVVDDDPSVSEMLIKLIKQNGWRVNHAGTVAQGLELARLERHEVVMLDVRLPDGIGLDHLTEFNTMPGAPVVIIMTAYGDPDGAELAIRNGAWDYLTKPISTDALILHLRRAIEYQAAKSALATQLKLKREDIVGDSRALMRTLDQVLQASGSDANVLIYGETGSGKELVARAVHDNSPRGLRRFVVVDCAALPETLVESLLFGHEKGAFTGAHQKSEGLIKQAHGGTLFLDEIGELPFNVQKSLLRVLQERKYRPVGSNDYISSDFRLIAATNKDLEEMAAKNLFREDLLFRLRSLLIKVPALRERQEDLDALVTHYMKKFCFLTNLPTKQVSPEFLEALKLYHWPGNVRELFSTIESSISEAQNEPVLMPIHLPVGIRAKVIRKQTSGPQAKAGPSNDSTAALHPLPDLGQPLPSFKDFRSDMERRYLEQLMLQTEGSRTEACRISGLSRTRMFELLKKHKIS